MKISSTWTITDGTLTQKLKGYIAVSKPRQFGVLEEEAWNVKTWNLKHETLSFLYCNSFWLPWHTTSLTQPFYVIEQLFIFSFKNLHVQATLLRIRINITSSFSAIVGVLFMTTYVCVKIFFFFIILSDFSYFIVFQLLVFG